MREGDIIEWRGVNVTQHGRVTRTEADELLVRMENGRTFPLDVLLGSKHIKTYETLQTFPCD